MISSDSPAIFMIDVCCKYVAIVILTLFFFNVSGQNKSPAEYVNPFIGATTMNGAEGQGGSLGKTFPGAATPFGMTQVSPNTITGGDNGSGYSYEHKTIEGFALTQMSGVGWYGDLGNFLVMPTVGAVKTSAGTEGRRDGYRSAYDKASEKASAGYYSVLLTDHQIKAEVTATPHCGMMRFTFPGNDTSNILIDLARRVGGTSTTQQLTIVSDSVIEGWMKCTPDGGGWGNGDGHANYTVYFHAEFSRAMDTSAIWNAAIPDDWSRKRDDVQSPRYQDTVAHAAIISKLNGMQGRHIGLWAGFRTHRNEQIVVRAGISFVSVEGAAANLKTEITNWNFDAVHAAAVAAWNKALSVIAIEGGTEEERVCFYTALYHTMIDPRLFEDVNGMYPGGDGKAHKAKGFVKRTVFSGWDVYRSQMPLQTIINPAVANDLVNSMISLADENGARYFDRWEFLNAYSGCMIGNPLLSVLADMVTKDIARFDKEKAYRFAVNTAQKFGNGEKGYYPGDNSISNTLEYAYTDWCMAQFARALGKDAEADVFQLKSAAYKNVFDSTKQWFRPKNADGSWQPWPKAGRLAEGYGCVESNPYQQGWFVPHDVDGLTTLLGGRRNTISELDSFFSATPRSMQWNPYYNHANEPVHHVAFLFNHLDTPSLTQKWTRAICQRAYRDSVEGLVGNDDAGQMSAWYVLASSGLHPLCPGDPHFDITSPVFNDIKIRPANGKKIFEIVAHGNSRENVYIQSARLNGRSYESTQLDYKTIMAGGKLELEMGPEPSLWGKKRIPSALPQTKKG